MSDVVHVYPNYGPEHDTETEEATCWCAPAAEEVERDDGTTGTVIIHREVN